MATKGEMTPKRYENAFTQLTVLAVSKTEFELRQVYRYKLIDPSKPWSTLNIEMVYVGWNYHVLATGKRKKEIKRLIKIHKLKI